MLDNKGTSFSLEEDLERPSGETVLPSETDGSIFVYKDEIKAVRNETLRKMVEGWSDLRNDLDKLDKRVNKLGREVQIAQASIFSALGVFVALFTFVSLSIQIFQRIDDGFSASLVLSFLLLSLLAFAALIGFLVANRKYLLWVTLGLVFMALLVVYGFARNPKLRFHPVSGSFQFSEDLREQLENIVDGRLKLKMVGDP